MKLPILFFCKLFFIFSFVMSSACRPINGVSEDNVFAGYGRHWHFMFSHNPMFKFEKKIRPFGDSYFTLYDSISHIELEVTYDWNVGDTYPLKGESFCEKNLKYRQVDFVQAFPCGDEVQQKKIMLNNECMILTEVYCRKTSDFKFEIYGPFDKGILIIRIFFFNYHSTGLSQDEIRKEVERIYTSIKIIR